MRKQSCLLWVLLLAVPLFAVRAEEVKLPYAGLTLNANLERTDAWPSGITVLMTHRTLAHNGLEIMRTLQDLFKEREMNSLAINLSLGVNDRKDNYDCIARHTHKHRDAIDEIGTWLGWLKQQGVKEIVLLGHSRGGNQTAWFAADRDEPSIEAVALVAPMSETKSEITEDHVKRYGKSPDPVLARARQLVEAGRGDEVLENTDFLYCAGASVTAATFVDYYEATPRRDTASFLTEIPKPVIVFAATEDTVVRGLENKVAPVADGKRIRLVVMDGADHAFRDLYAEDLADAVAEFLANI